MNRSIIRFVVGLFIVLGSLASIGGCGPTLSPPSNYIALNDAGRNDFKAVSAQGHAIVVNQHENEDKNATLDFWTAAVEHQLVDLDGLTLVDRVELRAHAESTDGVLMRFEVGEPPQQLTYFVGVYVTPKDVFTLEAVGPREALEGEAVAIKKAFESIKF